MVIQSLNGVYLHAAWATSIDGDDFSLTEFPEATYCGSYSDNSSTESTNPMSYTWLEIGEMSNDTEIDTADIAAYAKAQAAYAQAQTIINNDNIQASQDDTDMSTGNPNELVGTNQGDNNWTASAGLTISAQSGTIYNPNDEAVNYLHVACDTAGTNYIAFDASILRDKLAELTEDNSFTLSADINMSTVFDMPVMVSDTDGSNIQIDFGVIEPELVPVPEETADGLWVFSKSTADCENEVAVSSQVVLFDLSNMGAGETLDIANLKIEGGALATPWRASLDEVANIANQAYSVANNTQQHFWFQSTGLDTGAHITEVDKDTWDLDPSNGGGNLLARSNGIALRDGLQELATITADGQMFNNEYSLPVFENGRTERRTYNSKIAWYEYSNESPFEIVLAWDVQTIQHVYGYDASRNNVYTVAAANYSLDGRTLTIDSTACSALTAASVKNVVVWYKAEGRFPFLTFGSRIDSAAIGNYSAVIGENNVASGATSAAFGDSNISSGVNSFSAGIDNKAQYRDSAAFGQGNVTRYDDHFVVGKFNDVGYNHLFTVGNGTDDNNRSNAFYVNSGGNVVASGDITAGVVHSITVGLGANTAMSFSTTYSYLDIPIDTTLWSYGSAAHYSSNTIVIDKSGYYRVSGAVSANQPTYARIMKNSTRVSQVIVSAVAGYISGTLPPVVIQCTAGDVIHLQAAKSTSSNPTIAGTSTYMTVEKV